MSFRHTEMARPVLPRRTGRASRAAPPPADRESCRRQRGLVASSRNRSRVRPDQASDAMVVAEGDPCQCSSVRSPLRTGSFAQQPCGPAAARPRTRTAPRSPPAELQSAGNSGPGRRYRTSSGRPATAYPSSDAHRSLSARSIVAHPLRHQPKVTLPLRRQRGTRDPAADDPSIPALQLP
jgi:hypothetical protein